MSDSLWSSLLRESSKRSKLYDSYCVFVGDSSCGKNKLLEKICGSTDAEYVKEIISYNYLEVDEGIPDSSKVNIWSIGDKCFDLAFETIIHPEKNDKLIFMIGIDLTKPPEECIESLKRWLFEIESYSKAYHATIGHDITEDLKLQLKSYIQNARNRNSSSDNLDENQSSHGTNEGLLHNWGVPIIIVGCKSDYLTSKEEKISTKKSKDLQGQLRSMCMQLGAGLIYSSAVNDINCNLLKKYILHRLYPEHISMDLELEDGIDNCFIPAGFDTMELISILAGRDYHDIYIPLDFTKSLSMRKISLTVNTSEITLHSEINTTVVSQLESEDEWLTSLQQYIQQVSENPSNANPAILNDINKLKSRRGSANTPSVTSEDLNSYFQKLSQDASATMTGVTAPTPSSNAASKPRRTPATSTSKDKDVKSFFQDLLK